MGKSSSIGGAMIYKTLERYFTLAFQLIVQIVIARILSPTDYGIVAMMAVFISVANIFINNGFNMAVIQKKEINDKDFPTALTINMLIGIFLYVILFFTAPSIAGFYNTPELEKTLRILALILPFGSIYSIQNAIATRLMHFKNLFICSILGSVLSGIIGIVMAVLGFGYWALIGQQLSNVIIATVALTLSSSWKPRFGFNGFAAKEMFSFGSHLLVAGLINQLYNQLNSLVIGKKYTSADLAFYTKGRVFPSYITTGLESALQSVSLSVFSKKQDDKSALHSLMTKLLQANTYLSVPILIFFFVCADQIISFLLTDKWLPAVPFVRLSCATFIFHPISSIGLQAIAAVGRSDIRLKLEFIKKPIGILLLLIFLSRGPVGIAMGAMISELISFVVGLIAVKMIVKYDVSLFIINILPAFLISSVVGLGVYIISFFLSNLHQFLTLLIEFCFASAFYFLISYLFKVKGLELLINQLKSHRKK